MEKVKQVKVRLKKSLIGRKPNHIKVANSLGLRRVNKAVEHYLTPSVAGMVNKISYMVEIEAIDNG